MSDEFAGAQMIEEQSSKFRLKEENLLELYKVAVDEIHKYHSLHQRRVGFFSGLSTSLIAVTIAGFLRSDQWFHYALIAIGPVVLLLICMIANTSINGIYRLLLETITFRGKIEQLLGLTEPIPDHMLPVEAIWGKEAIVPERHLAERRELHGAVMRSSGEWVSNLERQGIKRWTKLFFVGIAGVGVVLLILAISLALTSLTSGGAS